MVQPEADLGEGAGGGNVGRMLFLQGFDPLRTQRFPPPLYSLEDPFFKLTDPKVFLKGPSAPKYNNFEGGARAEKTQFYG